MGVTEAHSRLTNLIAGMTSLKAYCGHISRTLLSGHTAIRLPYAMHNTTIIMRMTSSCGADSARLGVHEWRLSGGYPEEGLISAYSC